MADKEGDEQDISVFIQRGNSSHIASEEISPIDATDPLAMKGQSVVASKLFSPSRTRRNEERIKPKSKPKGFVVHSSPVMKLTSASRKPAGPSKERRKTLQVLQPTASGDGTLVGSSGVIRHEKSKKKKSARSSKLKVYSTDDSTSTTTSQTESTDSLSTTSKKSDEVVIDETVALMVSDPPPERYWELLAEERRVALADALGENEQLHQELEELRERCKKLEEVAGQAEYFASLYNMVMEGEVETSDGSDTEL